MTCLTINVWAQFSYLDLPSYKNANKQIGIAGNDFYLEKTSNGYNIETNNLGSDIFQERIFRVCDPNTGTLLLYTRYVYNTTTKQTEYIVYNKDNEPIENGIFSFDSDAFSNINFYALAPIIGQTNQFYLFYSYYHPDKNYSAYAVVDMEQNNGKGAINVSQKEIQFGRGHSFGQIIAGNKCNLYFLNYDQGDMQFKVYEINDQGFNPSPIDSMRAFGQSPTNNQNLQIVVSPDRSKLAIAKIRLSLSELGIPLKYSSYIALLFVEFDPEVGKFRRNLYKEWFVYEEAVGSSPITYRNTDLNGIFTKDSKKFFLAINAINNRINNVWEFNLQQFTYEQTYLNFIDWTKKIKGYPPMDFYVYDNELLVSRYNLNSSNNTSAIIPYDDFKDMEYNATIAFNQNTNSTTRKLPFDFNNLGVFSIPVIYPFGPTDTIYTKVSDTFLCIDTFEIVLAKDSGNNFHWSNGSNDEQITVNKFGGYSVLYQGTCAYRLDSFFVQDSRSSLPHIKFDTVICEERFPFYLTNPNKGSHYVWNNENGVQNFRVEQPTTDIIASVKVGQCWFTDTVSVLSQGKCGCETYIPNAFSPNNDGLNDYFKPLFLGGCAPLQYQFLIFDRWGNLVYKSNNEFDKGWDGSLNGKPLKSDVYYYNIYYKSNTLTEPFSEKGSITLLR